MRERVLTFVGVAAFPGLAYRLRWPTRLGGRGLACYVAFLTLFNFALRHWLVPTLRRKAAEIERVKEELAGRLGREPTDEELARRLGFVRDS